MLYHKKPITVEAHQWFPGKTVAGVRRIPANKIDMSQKRGIVVDRPERYVVDAVGGQLDIYPGDWVITGLGGDRYPLRNDVFMTHYEPVYSTMVGFLKRIVGLK